VEEHVRTRYKLGIDIITSNELVILCARTLIAEGVLDKEKVEFIVNGESIGFCNSLGKLEIYPDDLLTYERLLERIVDVMFNNAEVIRNGETI
jgi:hypothetical protein